MNVTAILFLLVAGALPPGGGVRVNTPGGVLTAEVLEGVVRGMILEACSGDAAERTITFQATRDTLRTGGDFCTVELGVDDCAALRGTVHVPVMIRQMTGRARAVTLLPTVRVFTVGPVAARRLESRRELTDGDWVMKRIEMTTQPRGVVSDPGDLPGRRTVRLVEEGSPFFAGMLEPAPIVRRGTTVSLVVRRGAVRLSVDAVAGEDGAEGDMISLRRRGSSERLRARVIDARTVTMDVQ